MRHFRVFVIASFFASVASVAVAKVPVAVKVTARSVQVASNRGKSSGKPVDFNKKMNELMADMNDPKISVNDVLIKYFESQNQKRGKIENLKKQFENNVESINAKYSTELAQYLDELALKQGAKKHRDGNAMIYTIEDGLRFYDDFYKFENKKDPWFRAIAEAFLSSGFRNLKIADKVEKLAVAVREKGSSETRLFDADQYTESDLQALQRIALGRKKETHYEKIGKTWVFGSGISYLVTKDLIKKGNSLQESTLKARFDKIIRYHAASGLPIIHNYVQGPVATFSLMEGQINFVLPSQVNLGAYTHEMTHSRFEKFTKTLDRWVASKKYSLPYQVEGPPKGGSVLGHGGFFNLLNEMNSWRIGESFEGPVLDAGILKTLQISYGNQAGYEATELLAKVWTPEKLKGKSIPYLIYDEIRRFNKMSNDDLVMMGFESVEENDLVKKMNFLMMYRNGRFKETVFAEDAQFVLEEIARQSEEPEVRQRLAQIDSRFKGPEAGGVKPSLSSASFREIYTEFVEKGSAEAKKRIIEKHLQDLNPEHLRDLVERILQTSQGSLNSRSLSYQGVEVLRALFEHHHIGASWQRDRGKARPLLFGNPYLEALDLALSERAYDGGIATKKIDLFNFVAQYTRPEEMPRTYVKSMDLLVNAESRAATDVWLAHNFFYPEGGDSAGRSVLWGERLIQDLLGRDLSAKIKESMGVFYKVDVAASLVEVESHKKYEQAPRQLSEEQLRRLDTASRNLWILAGDWDPKVRNSAFYAMITNPLFLLKNQGRLLQALYNKDPHYAKAVAFFTDAAPEMIPQAKRILDIQTKKQPTGIGPGSKVKSCEKIFQ